MRIVLIIALTSLFLATQLGPAFTANTDIEMMKRATKNLKIVLLKNFIVYFKIVCKSSLPRNIPQNLSRLQAKEINISKILPKTIMRANFNLKFSKLQTNWCSGRSDFHIIWYEIGERGQEIKDYILLVCSLW